MDSPSLGVPSPYTLPRKTLHPPTTRGVGGAGGQGVDHRPNTRSACFIPMASPEVAWRCHWKSVSPGCHGSDFEGKALGGLRRSACLSEPPRKSPLGNYFRGPQEGQRQLFQKKDATQCHPPGALGAHFSRRCATASKGYIFPSH